MNAMILCAGLGTRFKPVTDSIPKSNIEFLTLPLLSYSLYYANRLNVKNTIVNTHYLPKKIEDTFLNLPQNKSKVLFSNEQPNILGSGGGLKNAENLFNDKEILVLNGDNICLFKNNNILEDFYNEFIKNDLDISFLACNKEEAGKSISALWTNTNNELLYVGKTCGDKLAMPLHYAGIYLVKKEIFSLMPNNPFCIFTDFVLPNLSILKASIFKYDNLFWHETGNLTDFLKATKLALSQLESSDPYGLKEILNFYQAEYSLKNNQMIANSAVVGSARIEGSAVVGNFTTIDDNSSLNNCIIHSGANIKKLQTKDQYLY